MAQEIPNGQAIRVFIGTTTLNEDGREQAAAVFTLSKIDEGYVADPSKKPCGKVRLQPELDFELNGGAIHKGVLLVPEDKIEAIQTGCSMQNGKLDEPTRKLQAEEYKRGQLALNAL